MCEIETISFNSEYFNDLSTLDCGQIFRFTKLEQGFMVLSKDKCAIIQTKDAITTIKCRKNDKDYFINFFDLARDYKSICDSAKQENVSILNQDKEETLFSFIISQNNNIPRIKGIIEKLCTALGEKKEFLGIEYYSFPTADKMAEMDLSFYQSIGLGYRARYILNLAQMLNNGLKLDEFCSLSTPNLRKKLTSILGVGNKVADCVILFGYHKTDSFPVDTWIDKVYHQDFLGEQKDRIKIAEELTKRFGENAGYYQQYLFYHKRLIEK